MRLLLLHLSDLHVKSSRDPVLARGPALVNAVKNLDYELETAVIVFSGDLAYSGREEEYQAAWAFLNTLSTSLRQELKHKTPGQEVPVEFVVVPGNHDCAFDGSQKARSFVLDGVLKDPTQSLDPSVLVTCTAPQDTFFSFLEAHANRGRKAVASEPRSRLFYEYEFSVGGEPLRFLCVNTAWFSQREEKQGALTFPVELLPHETADDRVVIAVFHHPYNWIEADLARAFRKRIDQVADFVLTGHEHDSTCRTQAGVGGERQTYVEGGALQDSENPDGSAFNVFLLDTQQERYKYIQFRWDESMYTPPATAAQDVWREYQGNRIRQRNRFEIKPAMRESLEDPGLSLVHQNRGKLKLSDIYVYPDLQRIPDPDELVGENVPGDELLNFVLKASHLLITGDDQTGKTSLAKTLFTDLHQAGYVPLLLTGKNKPPAEDKLHSYLVKVFEEEYEPGALEAYRQLDTARRVVIVDDCHKIRVKAKARAAFLRGLSRFAGKILLFAHDLAHEVQEIGRAGVHLEGVPSFERYHLRPFGHVRRNKLIEKWLLTATSSEENALAFARQLDRITNTIDTIIGKNFVPAYPVFLLAVLQAAEASTPIDTRASTHGYFYELFIRVHLARGRNNTEFDFIMSYLSHLAWSCFIGKAKELDSAQFSKIHQDYVERFDVPRPMHPLLQELLEANVLVEDGSILRFKYPYFYYYFVASWMRDHIGEDLVRSEIKRLSRAVHVADHANILLFLAHLSKDPIIIAEMQVTANDLYSDSAPAALERDVDFVNTIAEMAIPTTYAEQNHNTARRERLELLDQEESDDSELDDTGELLDPASAMLNPLIRLNMALKTLQILGQTLKNFPGSLEGTTKLQIAQACYNLGRRVLGSVLGLLKDNQEALVQDLVRLIGAKQPQLSAEEIRRQAKGTLIELALLVCFGMTKRISHAVGSPDLETTYNRLLDQNRETCVKLIHTSLSLDHIGTLPVSFLKELGEEFKTNPLAMTLLRLLVVEYFNLFPVQYKDKQRVCQALGIEITKVRGPVGSKGLLSSPLGGDRGKAPPER